MLSLISKIISKVNHHSLFYANIDNLIRYSLYGRNKNSKPGWLKCRHGMPMSVEAHKLNPHSMSLIHGLMLLITSLKKNSIYK